MAVTTYTRSAKRGIQTQTVVDVTPDTRNDDVTIRMEVTGVHLEVSLRQDVVHLDALAHMDQKLLGVHLTRDYRHEKFGDISWSDVAAHRVGVPFVACRG